MKYETVIGLEVHVQLKTKSKIFCTCSTEFGAPANTNVCPVCSGMPGVLPVINQMAVEYALRASLALNCRIAPLSVFARKNYFYPDLPKNYQISQYENPLATDGFVEILLNGHRKRIRIIRVHLEEDAGKLLHAVGSRKIEGSLVDFNRCGIPLLEIVSHPEISTPREAYEYLSTLKSILQYAGVSNCNMEEGSLRCDANVSIAGASGLNKADTIQERKLGTKTEVKNMNSFKAVKSALEYEVQRQKQLLERGEKVVQETRLWNEEVQRTCSMRSKEEAHDYRYFPEPDLVPLKISQDWINRIKANLPELPLMRKQRFIKDYGLSEYDAGVLTSEKELADYFEEAVCEMRNAKWGIPASLRSQGEQDIEKQLSNWITVELLGKLNASNKTISESPVSPEQLTELLALMNRGTISGKMAKSVFDEMFSTGNNPEEIVKKKGLIQITDTAEIGKLVEEVIKENPDAVTKIKEGKDRAISHLVGQVMRKTQGKANPQMVNRILKEKISRLF